MKYTDKFLLNVRYYSKTPNWELYEKCENIALEITQKRIPFRFFFFHIKLRYLMAKNHLKFMPIFIEYDDETKAEIATMKMEY